MKKLLALAVIAVFAGAASAATLKWGWGSGSLFLANEGDTKAIAAKAFTGDTSDISLVLVHLGTVSSFTAADITADNVVDSIAYDASGNAEESFWKPQNQDYVVVEGGEHNFAANDYFGIALKIGSKYVLAKDITNWDDGIIGEDIAPVAKVSSLAANAPVTQLAVTASAFTTDGAAAVVVPEPSVALLGLLGLGMLLKRRRA